MEKILKISIPSYSQRQKSKPHIVYHISITAPVRSWTVQHRYSEFFNLNKRFLDLGLKPPLDLPPKTSIFSFTSYDNPSFVESRRQSLEEYLQAILASKDERFKKLPEWKEFLGISHLKNRNNTDDNNEDYITSPSLTINNDGNNNGISSAVIDNNSQSHSMKFMSSEEWLEECRDLNLVINGIRTCIAARNKFVFRNETAAACESIVLARKNYSNLCTRYAALERELHRQWDEYYNSIRQSENNNEESHVGFFSSVLGSPKKQINNSLLSKGELTRRQDLLENIRTEKEQLEKQLGNVKSSNNLSQNNQGKSSTAPKDSVYFNSKSNNSNNPNSSGKIKSRRKFGVNISQEVEESTKGLDNVQILQLQKNMLKDQDKTLEQFSTILNRQRRIGETINQELDLQNELLDDLDSNVNKVQQGLGQVDKRVKKVLKK